MCWFKHGRFNCKRKPVFSRSILLLGGLVALAVSGCQSTRPAMTSVGFETQRATITDSWPVSKSLIPAGNESVETPAIQASHVAVSSTVLNVSHSESMVVEASHLCDFCSSCEPQCKMTCCLPTGLCCLDNPCQMPPHYAYSPSCHGYRQFAPYNQSNVMRQKEIARQTNNDPRQPYKSDVFQQAYARVVGQREEDVGEEVFQQPVGLPNLLDIVGS